MTGVRLEALNKKFGDTEIIRDVSLEVAAGEFVVFVGPSGCGKSTLLRLIAGLEEATSGRIRIGEDDVTDLPPALRGVSMVFQSYALYPHMDAYRNIAFGLKMAGTAGETVDQRVRRVADKLKIGDLLQRYPRQLSGGQRQRVAIARAIVREPRVFLFDEPLSNLDAALRAETRLEIARLHDELSATMIYVTHDQQEAMTLADRIVLLNKGRIEQVGSPADLYQKPQTRFAARFIGSPPMNMLDADIADGKARLSSGASLDIGTGFSGSASIGIRPEAVALTSSGEPGAVQARLVHIEDLGDTRVLYAELADGSKLAVRCAADVSLPKKGATVALRIDPKNVHVFTVDGRRVD